EESAEPFAMASKLSPPTFLDAFMSDSLPPPVASQANASVPPLFDRPCNFEEEESSLLDDILSLQTGMTPGGASVHALRPVSLAQQISSPPLTPLNGAMMSRTGSLNDRRLISPATRLFTPEPIPICCPMNPVFSSATSAPPVCAEPPHPPRLASRQFMSMTSSPVAPIVFDQMSATTSLIRSGGFGGFLRSTNEPLGFGSSASGPFGAPPQELKQWRWQRQQQILQQQQQAQQIVRQQLAMRFSEA
ncbi:hypothetical protein M9458_019795, partial [Cirrhinus mrigala]